jgi:hypothetical protein
MLFFFRKILWLGSHPTLGGHERKSLMIKSAQIKLGGMKESKKVKKI